MINEHNYVSIYFKFSCQINANIFESKIQQSKESVSNHEYLLHLFGIIKPKSSH